MSDIALASNAASNLRDPAVDAADLEKFFVDGAILAKKNAVPAVDANALARKFDGRMHGRMSSAQNPGDWMEISKILVNAYTNNNLRANVRDRFLKDCQYIQIVTDFKVKIGYVEPKQKADVVDIESLNQRFDDNLFGRMADARSRKFWTGILETVVRAKQNKNLRAKVRNAFFALCPFADLVDECRKQTGCPESTKKSKKK